MESMPWSLQMVHWLLLTQVLLYNTGNYITFNVMFSQFLNLYSYLPICCLGSAVSRNCGSLHQVPLSLGSTRKHSKWQLIVPRSVCWVHDVDSWRLLNCYFSICELLWTLVSCFCRPCSPGILDPSGSHNPLPLFFRLPWFSTNACLCVSAFTPKSCWMKPLWWWLCLVPVYK